VFFPKPYGPGYAAGARPAGRREKGFKLPIRPEILHVDLGNQCAGIKNNNARTHGVLGEVFVIMLLCKVRRACNAKVNERAQGLSAVSPPSLACCAKSNGEQVTNNLLLRCLQALCPLFDLLTEFFW
jgi:hypothetical protein